MKRIKTEKTTAGVDEAAIAAGTGRRRRSVLKAQKRAIVILIACIVLLAVGLGVAKYYVDQIIFKDSDGLKYYVKEKNGKYLLCDKDGYTLETTKDGYFSTTLGTLVEVNEKTGAYNVVAVVDTEDGEDVGALKRILMFRHTKQESIQSIEVHGKYSTYTFYRDSDDNMQLKGFEGTPYDQALFSSLAVSCGYPLTMQKIQNPIKDANGKFTEYGLDDQKRIDENGNEYDYSPMWYRMIDTSNNVHVVYVGDMIPSGGGYYVRYRDRDAVYIMNYSVDASTISVYGQSTIKENASCVFELKIETFITPMLCYPMKLNDYFDVQKFTIVDGKKLIAAGENEDVDPFISFSFWDMDSRTGTFYANTAYVMNYPEGYNIDSNRADSALQSFYQMKFNEVTKLGPNEDDMKKYGLEEPKYIVFFVFKDIEHTILISEMTDRGTYYACSSFSDMIVEVDRTQMLFLEYRLVDWVDSSYFSMNLAWATDVILETNHGNYHFYLDNALSDSVTNPATCSDNAKKDGTISSDSMVLRAEGPDGKVMESVSNIVVTDSKGFTWTIDEKKVTAVDASGKKASIRGGKYETNSRGEEVVVLVGSINDVKTGTKIEVNADTIVATFANGTTKTYLRCGMSTFRKFFQSLLYASIGGDAHDGELGLTDEQIAVLSGDADKMQAKLTVLTSYDKKSKLEYRFYGYTERRSLLAVGDSAEFYVSRSFVDKIISDAERVMNGEIVTPTGKY